MAEAKFGVAKNLKHVVMLTLGTGVGGGILIDGKLYQGVSQMAGHLGHVTVHAEDSVKDVTNMPGSLEDAIGNLTIRERTKGKFETTWDLVKAYEAKDSFATDVWLSSIRKLAVSIASFINVLSPELVIIGGGISKAEGLLLKPLNEYLTQVEWRPGGKQTKKFEYDNESIAVLASLVLTAKEERYFEHAQEEIEALRKELLPDRAEDVIRFRTDIEEVLRNEIVSRYHHQTGRAKAGLAYDPYVKKAVDLFASGGVAPILAGSKN